MQSGKSLRAMARVEANLRRFANREADVASGSLRSGTTVRRRRDCRPSTGTIGLWQLGAVHPIRGVNRSGRGGTNDCLQSRRLTVVQPSHSSKTVVGSPAAVFLFLLPVADGSSRSGRRCQSRSMATTLVARKVMILFEKISMTRPNPSAPPSTPTLPRQNEGQWSPRLLSQIN